MTIFNDKIIYLNFNYLYFLNNWIYIFKLKKNIKKLIQRFIMSKDEKIIEVGWLSQETKENY